MIEGFGARLVACMEMRNMGRAELAERAGLTEAAISRYITGDREPKAIAVAQIAKALGTTSDSLLGVETTTEGLDEALLVVARNANAISPEQKKALINALLG